MSSLPYHLTSPLRQLVRGVPNQTLLNPALLLRRFKHDAISESYNEIKRSSSEKHISSQIVGRMIRLFDNMTSKQETLSILDIGSNDASMLSNCLTQANLPTWRQVSLMAVDKDKHVMNAAQNTLGALAKINDRVQYSTVVADIFSENFLTQAKPLIPRANIILLMNVLYGTKQLKVKDLVDVLQRNFLADNGVLISAHAAETPNGVINLINRYAYNSMKLGEDGNDQPSIVRSIISSNGFHTVNMRWPIRLYFRTPSSAEWKILENPDKHHELENNTDMLRLLEILIFLCKQNPMDMQKRTKNNWDSLLDNVKASASSNRLNGSASYLADEIDVVLIPSKEMSENLQSRLLAATQEAFLTISQKSIDIELRFYENWAKQQMHRNLPEKPRTMEISHDI